MTNNSLVVMIVCWNNVGDAIECADSLLVQKGITLTILLVDNDSSKETVEALQAYAAQHDSVTFIESGSNNGTAGGFNTGIRWGQSHKYPYVGTLNADAVADPNWAAGLIKELSDDSVGMATGILARRDGKTLDTTGDFYTSWGLPGPRGRDQSIETAPKEPGDVFGSTGGGFIAKTALFDDIGLFDEAFFMYYEDVDISFRAQLRGWRVRYTPAAKAYHKLGASSSTVPGLATYQTFKNLPAVFVKNVPFSLWLHMYPRFILTYSLILGHAIVKGRARPALKGWLTSWVLLPHMLSKRRIIQKSRRVDDEYIDRIILHDIPPDQTGLRKFRKFFIGK